MKDGDDVTATRIFVFVLCLAVGYAFVASIPLP